MNNPPESDTDGRRRPEPRAPDLLLIAAVVGAGLLGAFVSRIMLPSPHPVSQQFTRPIVQFVRQQPGLPNLADVIDRLCPSVATIVPHDQASPVSAVAPSRAGIIASPATPAFQVSADGWLLASASLLPNAPVDAVFGDGRRVAASEVRSDPVSGLSIVKTDATGAQPMPLNDQVFPRVGEFGFVLGTPSGNGCTAGIAMIAGDFLADGGGLTTYVRIRTGQEAWTGGVPFVGADGRVIGVGATAPGGAIVPGPLAALIVDELIRNNLSATTNFGFRAIDFAPPLSARLGLTRSGAGIALVEAKSPADAAGLKAGDIVGTVNGVPVSSASELGRALDAVPRTATLEITRRGVQVKVVIPRSPA